MRRAEEVADTEEGSTSVHCGLEEEGWRVRPELEVELENLNDIRLMKI